MEEEKTQKNRQLRKKTKRKNSKIILFLIFFVFILILAIFFIKENKKGVLYREIVTEGLRRRYEILVCKNGIVSKKNIGNRYTIFDEINKDKILEIKKAFGTEPFYYERYVDLDIKMEDADDYIFIYYGDEKYNKQEFELYEEKYKRIKEDFNLDEINEKEMFKHFDEKEYKKIKNILNDLTYKENIIDIQSDKNKPIDEICN